MDVSTGSDVVTDLITDLLANTDGLIPLLEQIRDSLFFISYIILGALVLLVFYGTYKFISGLFR